MEVKKEKKYKHEVHLPAQQKLATWVAGASHQGDLYLPWLPVEFLVGPSHRLLSALGC